MNDTVSLGRIVASSEASELFSIVTAILSLPRPAKTVDAFLVFDGMGETWRVLHAVSIWQQSGVAARRLLIAGSSPAEDHYERLTLERLSRAPFFLARKTGVDVLEEAANTKIQAEWAAECIAALRLKSAALFVSAYHLPRAYLTLLKACGRKNCNRLVPIVPMPTPVALSREIPEVGVRGYAMVAGEVQRIAKYQEKGDVATFGELERYLSWLWSHPLIAAHSVA